MCHRTKFALRINFLLREKDQHFLKTIKVFTPPFEDNRKDLGGYYLPRTGFQPAVLDFFVSKASRTV